MIHMATTISELTKFLWAFQKDFSHPISERVRVSNKIRPKIFHTETNKEQKVEESCVCYNCNKTGHLSKNCPLKKKKRVHLVGDNEEESEGDSEYNSLESKKLLSRQ